MKCTECGAEMPVYARFCPECGAQPVRFCAECGRRLEPGESACPGCGYPFGETVETALAAAQEKRMPIEAAEAPVAVREEDALREEDDRAAAEAYMTQTAASQPAGPPPRRRSRLKLLLILSLALLLVALAVVGVLLVFRWRSGDAQLYLYAQDGELYAAKLDGKNSVEKLRIAGALGRGSSASYLLYASRLSENGKYFYYFDRYNEYDNTGTLYRAELADGLPDRERAVKVDTGVSIWELSVSPDGERVLYKDAAGVAYLHDLEKRAKIDVCDTWYVDAAFEQMIYMNSEGKLYRRELKVDGEREKLANIDWIEYISEDLGTCFYIRDGVLYRLREGGEPEALAEDVISALKIVEDEGLYFSRTKEQTMVLAEYVEDDLREEDAAMQRPREEDFRTPREEQGAFGVYTAYDFDWEAFDEANDAYSAKLARDALRRSLQGEEEYRYVQELHYLSFADGSVTKLADDAELEVTQGNDLLTVYREFRAPEPVKISEAEDIYDLRAQLDLMRYTRSVRHVVFGAQEKRVFGPEEKSSYLQSNAAGDKLYYISGIDGYGWDDGSEDWVTTGTLVCLTLQSDGSLTEEILDEEVGQIFLPHGSDTLFYFKNIEEYSGELYRDGERICAEASLYSIQTQGDTLLLQTDYSSRFGTCTLLLYDGGELKKVADDAAQGYLTPDGQVLYLADYSFDRPEGDLCLYVDEGRTVQLAQDVSAATVLTAGR